MRIGLGSPTIGELIVDNDLDMLSTYQVKNLASPATGEALRKGNKDIANAEVADAAVIAYAKLALTGELLMGDLATAIKNAANGLAVLDASADIPDAQIPSLAASKITSGYFDKDRLEATVDKFLIGAGAGSAMTEGDKPSAGEGFIAIFPLSYSAIGQGTWAQGLDALYYLNARWRNTTQTDGDNISYQVYLAAGTYKLGILVHGWDTSGIMDIDIGGAEVASFDLYSSGTVKNSWQTQASIAIATAGLKTLTIRADGKNGSSSAYLLEYSILCLWRTA